MTPPLLPHRKNAVERYPRELHHLVSAAQRDGKRARSRRLAESMRHRAVLVVLSKFYF